MEAAQVRPALRQRMRGSLRIAGIGGERMQEQGLTSLVPQSDIAVAGVAEVLPRAPVILRRVRETVAAIRTLRPSGFKPEEYGAPDAVVSPFIPELNVVLTERQLFS